MYFLYFVIISFEKREVLILTYLKDFYPIMPCVVDIDPVVLKEKVQNFVYLFSLFRNYRLLEKIMALHLDKLDFPSTKNALCRVRCFWRRRFLDFVNVFSLLSPFESHSSKDFYTKFGWNWPSSSGEEDENVKSLQKDGRTDGRQAIRTFRSGELKSKKSGEGGVIVGKRCPDKVHTNTS